MYVYIVSKLSLSDAFRLLVYSEFNLQRFTASARFMSIDDGHNFAFLCFSILKARGMNLRWWYISKGVFKIGGLVEALFSCDKKFYVVNSA